jgi:histone H3/H4
MKLNDNKRIQHLWEEILSQNSTKSHLPTVLQDNAKQLIFEYSEELTQALIDSAATVAENRGSKQIDDSDIALLLGTVLIYIFVIRFMVLMFSSFSEKARCRNCRKRSPTTSPSL